MPECPQCGEELDADNIAGLCPRCLIECASDTGLDVETSGTRTIDNGAGTDIEDEFGRYRILRILGEGGMGAVYLAEQREPIRRSVALKVIKLGMDTRQVLARFVNERQALAIMDHPNIARIFDAGATRRGRPYFVMEYIEGAPITQYCDRTRAPIAKRLELFLQVCGAVHHAHLKSVIHRDIKPSNVLVAESDGVPIPKVIDFGIAKATDQWAVENSLLTQFGQMIGTPEYASPEQADVMTEEVDQTSDVYSLGVLLYELLIGTVPFDVARMRRAGIREMLRIIREEDAPTLSRRLAATDRATVGEIAARRGTDPASLCRQVNGDLNWITAKALDKVRERRYASVADLASDVERHLKNEPVLASPPSRFYRTRKFVRRHRSAFVGAVASAAFLVLGGVSVWTFVRGESPQKPKRAEKGVIVLGDFANATADAGFNSMREALAVQLGRSPDFTILSDARISETLHLMLRPSNARLTPDIASEVCERTGSAAVVDGSITSLGNQYLLSLRAQNCRTGDALDQEQAQTPKKEDAFTALADMGKRLEARAAGFVVPVRKEPSLFTEVTTPSLEAWRTLGAAMKSSQTKGAQAAESLALLKRVTEIDPEFAMAYAYLGRTYAALGEFELGAQNTRTAYKLRNRVSDRENYFITFNYHRQVTRNLEMARQTLNSWAQQYPEQLEPHGFLAAFTSQGAGRYDKAAEEGEKAIQIEPNYSIGYINLTYAYIHLNRLSEAAAVLHRASERKIEVPEFSACRYLIAFLRGDQRAMDRETADRASKLESQGLFEHQEALSAAYHGRVKEANRLSERAVSLSRQAGLRERAAQFEGARAAWNALFEVRPQAERSSHEALALCRGRDADYGPALALSFAGEPALAHRIALDLARRYPEDTSVQFSYLPALRGLAALNQGNAAEALEMAQLAAPYDLAVPGTAFYDGAFFGALYPVYVRGLAYSKMGGTAKQWVSLRRSSIIPI